MIRRHHLAVGAVTRVVVAYPVDRWEAVPDIRSAARGLWGLHGLVEAQVSTREEPGPGTAQAGPIADVAFETADRMREALGSEAWERLLVAGGGGAPVVRAYAVATVPLDAPGGAQGHTTDVGLAAEEAQETADAEPISTQMELPLSRPRQPEGEGAEQNEGRADA